MRARARVRSFIHILSIFILFIFTAPGEILITSIRMIEKNSAIKKNKVFRDK